QARADRPGGADPRVRGRLLVVPALREARGRAIWHLAARHPGGDGETQDGRGTRGHDRGRRARPLARGQGEERMNELETDDLARFRREIRAWIEESCPTSLRLPPGDDEDDYWGGRRAQPTPDQKIWFDRALGRGFTAPTWSKEYGGA